MTQRRHASLAIHDSGVHGVRRVRTWHKLRNGGIVVLAVMLLGAAKALALVIPLNRPTQVLALIGGAIFGVTDETGGDPEGLPVEIMTDVDGTVFELGGVPAGSGDGSDTCIPILLQKMPVLCE